MAVPGDQPDVPKVKPRTALIVVGLVAAGGYLFLKSRAPASGAAPAGASAGSPAEATTTYGLGPGWLVSVVKDLHSAPTKKPAKKKPKKKAA